MDKNNLTDETNLILSYSRDEDLQLHEQGHVFLGVAHDANDGEVHVFLRKGHPVVNIHHDRENGLP